MREAVRRAEVRRRGGRHARPASARGVGWLKGGPARFEGGSEVVGDVESQRNHGPVDVRNLRRIQVIWDLAAPGGGGVGRRDPGLALTYLLGPPLSLFVRLLDGGALRRCASGSALCPALRAPCSGRRLRSLFDSLSGPPVPTSRETLCTRCACSGSHHGHAESSSVAACRAPHP